MVAVSLSASTQLITEPVSELNCGRIPAVEVGVSFMAGTNYIQDEEWNLNPLGVIVHSYEIIDNIGRKGIFTQCLKFFVILRESFFLGLSTDATLCGLSKSPRSC